MATIEKQNMKLVNVTTQTTFTGLNTIAILNNSDDGLTISVDGGTNEVTLTTGQSLSLESSAGFTLPDILLDGTNMDAQVVTT